MSKISSFEELIIWQKGIELCTEIYSIIRTDSMKADFALCDQIRRAAISIPSNISEGFERNSYKAFAQFLLYAKGSAGELRTQIIIANKIGYITDQTTAELTLKAAELSRMIQKFHTYLKNVQSVSEPLEIYNRLCDLHSSSSLNNRDLEIESELQSLDLSDLQTIEPSDPKRPSDSNTI